MQDEKLETFTIPLATKVEYDERELLALINISESTLGEKIRLDLDAMIENETLRKYNTAEKLDHNEERDKNICTIRTTKYSIDLLRYIKNAFFDIRSLNDRYNELYALKQQPELEDFPPY